MTTPSTRARPLPVEDRQSMIIDAVIPLLLEHGQFVTSKQIAEAAGIAEGTIFRAFGDKETLINAAVERFMNGPAGTDHIAIDASLPLSVKLDALVTLMRDRVRDIMRMASMTGRRPGSNDPDQLERFNRMVAEVFAHDVDELRVSPEDLGGYVRMLAIATSIPIGGRELTHADILGFLQHGVLRSKD
jgi:AcrR family transcriptional regulator